MLAVNEKHKMNVEALKLEIHLVKMRTMDEIYGTYPLIRTLTPDIDYEKFVIIQDAMMLQGYQCVGAYDQDNLLRGLCGFWVTHRFYCGKAIRVDNIIVDKDCKGLGIGEALLKSVEKEAQSLGGCSIILDAYVSSKESHEFYLRNDMSVIGVHFIKSL
jgi:GNAT superfamily N-acetyltransferase